MPSRNTKPGRRGGWSGGPVPDPDTGPLKVAAAALVLSLIVCALMYWAN